MLFYLLLNHLTFCVEKEQDREINILIEVPHVEIKNGKLKSAVLTSVVIFFLPSYVKVLKNKSAILWLLLSLCNHPLSSLKHHDSVSVNSDLT